MGFAFFPFEGVFLAHLEKVYLRSQILERPSIGEYWNISCVPVLPKIVILECVSAYLLFPWLVLSKKWQYWNEKNGLVLHNTCMPVSGTWSILFP